MPEKNRRIALVRLSDELKLFRELLNVSQARVAQEVNAIRESERRGGRVNRAKVIRMERDRLGTVTDVLDMINVLNREARGLCVEGNVIAPLRWEKVVEDGFSQSTAGEATQQSSEQEPAAPELEHSASVSSGLNTEGTDFGSQIGGESAVLVSSPLERDPLAVQPANAGDGSRWLTQPAASPRRVLLAVSALVAVAATFTLTCTRTGIFDPQVESANGEAYEIHRSDVVTEDLTRVAIAGLNEGLVGHRFVQRTMTYHNKAEQGFGNQVKASGWMEVVELKEAAGRLIRIRNNVAAQPYNEYQGKLSLRIAYNTSVRGERWIVWMPLKTYLFPAFGNQWTGEMACEMNLHVVGQQVLRSEVKWQVDREYEDLPRKFLLDILVKRHVEERVLEVMQELGIPASTRPETAEGAVPRSTAGLTTLEEPV